MDHQLHDPSVATSSMEVELAMMTTTMTTTRNNSSDDPRTDNMHFPEKEQPQQQQQQKQQQVLLTPVVICILVTETAERFAYYGFKAILILYFTQDLLLDETTSIALFAYTTCLANFAPIIGAMVAEQWGRFRTILSFGCLYVLGLICLTMAAALTNQEEETEATTTKRTLTTIGLLAICLGTGGIKPCVSVFGADQVACLKKPSSPPPQQQQQQQHDEETQQIKEEEDGQDLVRGFFAIFYFCINVGALASFAIIPIIRAYFGFAISFLIPTMFMILALSLFYSKRNQYVYTDLSQQTTTTTTTTTTDANISDKSHPEEAPADLRTTFRIAAYLLRQQLRQSKLFAFSPNYAACPSTEHDHNTVNQQEEDPSTIQDSSTLSDSSLSWSQQARTIMRNSNGHHHTLLPSEDNTINDASSLNVKKDNPTTKMFSSSSLQHPFSPQRIQDVRQALQVLPILAMFPTFWLLYDQQGSVWTLQATHMRLYGLEPEQLNVLNPVLIILLVPLFDQILYPIMEQHMDISPLRRMSWGMLLAVSSFLASGFVEQAIQQQQQQQQDNDTDKSSLLSVFWQIPQIVLISVGEILLNVTGLEFAYAVSPDHLKGFLMALYMLTVAIGDFVGGILYASVFAHMNRAIIMYICAIFMFINYLGFCCVWRWWSSRQHDVVEQQQKQQQASSLSSCSCCQRENCDHTHQE